MAAQGDLGRGLSEQGRSRNAKVSPINSGAGDLCSCSPRRACQSDREDAGESKGKFVLK
jgi:hypothetical protein